MSAHEFWIEPEKFQVETDTPIVATLRNGQNFSGTALAYFENRFTRFEMVQGDVVISVTGRTGDSPALQMPNAADGLLIILHETVDSTLKYKTWEKFAKFAAHKDFEGIEARHIALGFARENFRESYSRHAKALLAVGGGAGDDRVFGLKTEFVALSNPYGADFDGQMRVQLFYDGAPRADTQIEVFRRHAKNVTISFARTDAQGVAAIPVAAGDEYLFDAVVLEPYAGDKDAVWQTYWAALTFSVPN